MCGICGIFAFDGSPVDRRLVENMSSAIRHRGPDGSGSFVSGEIGLGHRRLSIIDLAGGAQPITNEDASLQVVFNGEIYNFLELRSELEEAGHRFVTRSDTEVIVHGYEQWGCDLVTRFNGIFSFALWDSKNKVLLLARDHLGVKPLYYTLIGNRLLFSSEIKALLQDPECVRQVDIKSLGTLFTLRYVPSPDTLFKDIKKLPPAHILLARADGIEIRRYWKSAPQQMQRFNEGALIEQYQSLLEDSVRLQMRSDVPVGLFLSSGVDSGALLALMSQHVTRPVHTFTIGFEDGEESNETADARTMADQFGADHTEMMVSAKDYVDYYERYLLDIEEPVGNETAAAFYFVSLIASQKVKVALTGQGADEPWAGYPRHLGMKVSGLYGQLPSFLTDRILPGLVERFVRDPRARRSVLSLSERDVLTRMVKIYSFYSSAMKGELFRPWVKDLISTNGIQAKQALRRLQSDVDGLDPLTQMLYVDTRANLPDDLLMVGDKTSMANSIEARVPFLDYRLIEFVENLPPHLRLNGMQAKYLHKKAIEKWLPKKVIYRTKKGFSNPIHKWLGGRLQHFVEECLLSETAAVNLYFDREYIQHMLTQHQTNKQNYLRHIYLLISFELWHRQFISSAPARMTHA